MTPNNQHASADFIMLAPMEGVIDYTMRDIFAAIGGIDRLVTEFIRVSDLVLPRRVFKRYCPELSPEHAQKSGFSTGYQANNTPVYVQLLGDNPEVLATNAYKVQKMGAAGIDLNFGCPSKFVNRSCGGAYLLQWPEKLFDIVHTVRNYVDSGTPVTAKIRLGFKDKSLAKELVAACAEAGANEIAIHARTKLEGYKPPAHWHIINDIKQGVATPIIANGEMWSLSDISRCMIKSQCQRIMLGRGLVACPDLALIAKDPNHQAMNYCDSLLLLNYYYLQLSHCCDEKYRHSLIKQWMAYLRIQYPQYHILFDKIKRIKSSLEMQSALLAAMQQALHESDQSQLRRKIGGLNLSDYVDSVS